MKNNKGITLIALVITIIVMLILVAVTITIAVNGGLFDYASKAAKDTETKKQEEQEYASIADGLTYENLIDKFTSDENSSVTYSVTFICNNSVKAGNSNPTSVEEGESFSGTFYYDRSLLSNQEVNVISITMGGNEMDSRNYSVSRNGSK